MTHTPTPWVYEADDNVIIGGDGRIMTWQTRSIDCGIEQRDANAAFIVRAVNSHEALVSALQETLNEALGWLDEARGVTPDQLMVNEWYSRAVEVLNAAEKP